MPTHFSTGTKVHLATVPLASTTTITPQMKKSAHATSLVDQTEETFINCSEILREDNIPCMGEDSRLHWIGPNSDMPFMMVQAGAELFKTGIANPPKQALRSGSRRDLAPEPSPSRELPEKEAVEGVAAAGRATGRSVSHLMSAVTGAKPEPAHASESLLAQEKFRNTGPPLADFGPYGLALRLELTNKSFVPPYEPGAVVDDIKIEVFFNGEFSHATLMPSRYRTETKRGSELFKYFSGLRTHFMLERAWIIRAATRYADGSSRVPNAEARASALQRWQQMAASLQNEADTRGFNKWGDRTVMGEYLTSLAKLPMPEELQSLKRMGDLTYGVIDVVLTYGKGKKAESTHWLLDKIQRTFRTPLHVSVALERLHQLMRTIFRNFQFKACTESGIGFNNLFSSPADGHHTRGHIRPMGGMFEQPRIGPYLRLYPFLTFRKRHSKKEPSWKVMD
ncbi:hypothetical protein K490DRAFT_53951 [Saccharata proteae CBS 121410]|uniref:Uncharacterized protein n=1 Tax=Saccharata proteae CBS 121410 TaxID=1314787 RepID=A0A9P4LZF8_9PEZI|nr:hypothetical protein K490DRAFT_53951 [Saccharata proteae CBS 121410]